MNYSRRQLLEALGGSVAALWLGSNRALARVNADVLADVGGSQAERRGNFAYIYGNPELRAEFRKFLVNVFHLYPDGDVHALLTGLAAADSSDESVYTTGQAELGAIKPFLADLRFSLPALRKQKAVIGDQTVKLLGAPRRYDGYLELGSTGRYLDELEERLDIVGETFLISARAPTYSPADLIDRGQVTKVGTFIDLADYDPRIFRSIPPRSLDLVTVYIGFHHCPYALREAFLAGVRDVLRPSGRLVVRDHDVVNEKMRRMVGLAHDVFNMGTLETWRYNRDELRGFYSLQTLDAMLGQAGFRGDGRRLFQVGDPTRNALMAYRKA